MITAGDFEEAIRKIKYLEFPDPFPIPVAPNLPLIRNITVIDHEDVDGILVRGVATWSDDAMRYFATVIDDASELRSPEFWDNLMSQLTNPEE